MKIAIGLPNTGTFGGGFVTSFAIMMSQIKGEITLLEKKCCYIHQSRNDMFDAARNLDVDYLLMIDSDMVFPADAFHKLVALGKDVATGVYYQKQHPYRPNVYKWTGKDYLVHKHMADIPNDPFKVDSCGTGFMLISKKALQAYGSDMMRKHGKPFNHIMSDDGRGGEHVGEDTSFCMRMRDIGIEIWADPTIDFYHTDSFNIGKQHYEDAKRGLADIDKNKDGLDGWTTDTELAWLNGAAQGMESVVEIGSWKGRSTEAILEGCNGKVYAVDHFKGILDDNHWMNDITDNEDVFEEFVKNVGHYPNLNVMKMSSKEASDKFNGDKVDMVFIDASHDYDSVTKDIEMWLPKTKKIICGHDYSTAWPGVMNAVKDKFGEVNIIDTIWWKEIENV